MKKDLIIAALMACLTATAQTTDGQSRDKIRDALTYFWADVSSPNLNSLGDITTLYEGESFRINGKKLTMFQFLSYYWKNCLGNAEVDHMLLIPEATCISRRNVGGNIYDVRGRLLRQSTVPDWKDLTDISLTVALDLSQTAVKRVTILSLDFNLIPKKITPRTTLTFYLGADPISMVGNKVELKIHSSMSIFLEYPDIEKTMIESRDVAFKILNTSGLYASIDGEVVYIDLWENTSYEPATSSITIQQMSSGKTITKHFTRKGLNRKEYKKANRWKSRDEVNLHYSNSLVAGIGYMHSFEGKRWALGCSIYCDSETFKTFSSNKPDINTGTNALEKEDYNSLSEDMHTAAFYLDNGVYFTNWFRLDVGTGFIYRDKRIQKSNSLDENSLRRAYRMDLSIKPSLNFVISNSIMLNIGYHCSPTYMEASALDFSIGMIW